MLHGGAHGSMGCRCTTVAMAAATARGYKPRLGTILCSTDACRLVVDMKSCLDSAVMDVANDSDNVRIDRGSPCRVEYKLCCESWQ